MKNGGFLDMEGQVLTISGEGPKKIGLVGLLKLRCHSSRSC